MPVSPTLGAHRDETVVVNGETLPLMRDGRFPVYAYFPEGTKLFDASAMPPTLVPLNGVPTWALQSTAGATSAEISDDEEENDAELGVTVFRLVPYAPYIAVTAPILVDEPSKKNLKDVQIPKAFEFHDTHLLASAPGRIIVETCVAVAPKITLSTPHSPSNPAPPSEEEDPIQQPAIASLASNKQLLQESYSSYLGMNPDLSAFTPALSIAETLEVFDTMSEMVQRWKDDNRREPVLAGFSNLDDLSCTVPVIELPERVNCHALKVLLYKSGRIAEYSVTLAGGRVGPGNASAALYNCPRSREQLESCIRKVSFIPPTALPEEFQAQDNRTMASRGAKLLKMDPYVAGLRLPAIWKGPNGDCVIVPTRKPTVSVHEAPPPQHHHQRNPQVRVGGGGGGHYGGHSGNYQGNNHYNGYERGDRGDRGDRSDREPRESRYNNSSPTTSYPYSSGSSASSPTTGYAGGQREPREAGSASSSQHQYPSYGSSGGGTAPGVHLPSHVRARANERAAAAPSFRPAGGNLTGAPSSVAPRQTSGASSMSVGAAPYSVESPSNETQMSAAAVPYQSTNSPAPAPDTTDVAAVKPFIPKPRSHQASATSHTTQHTAPVPVVAGAPIAVGSTPPMQPASAPGSVPPAQRGSQVPSRNRGLPQ